MINAGAMSPPYKQQIMGVKSNRRFDVKRDELTKYLDKCGGGLTTQNIDTITHMAIEMAHGLLNDYTEAAQSALNTVRDRATRDNNPYATVWAVKVTKPHTEGGRTRRGKLVGFAFGEVRRGGVQCDAPLSMTQATAYTLRKAKEVADMMSGTVIRHAQAVDLINAK